MDDANFGAYLHSRSAGSTLTDSASGTGPQPLEIPAAAAFLRQARLGPGDFAILVCNLSTAPAQIYLGALYAGIVPILIPDQDADRNLPAVVGLTGTRVVWVSTEKARTRLQGQFPELRFLSETKLRSDVCAPAARSADDLAVLMPTSGSTGVPRLVQVTHGNLRANTEAIISSQGLQRGDKAMLILPISYCFGASVFHSHLAVGGHVVFDRRFMFPNRVLEAMDGHDCTTFAGVPTVYRTLLKTSRFARSPLPSLRRLLQAGGPLDSKTILEVRRAAPQAKFYVMYGATEATARISTLDPDEFDSHPESVGRPLSNVEVKIVGLTGEALAAGEVGEVSVRGSSVSRGYFADPEATAEKFHDGWLMTGDLGCLDADGLLYIRGRRSDFIKMRGVRVSLREIEHFVRGVEGVDDVAACSVRNEDHGEAIGLVVVPAPGEQADELQTRIRGSVPMKWKLASVTTVSALPRTASGKLDGQGVRALLPENVGHTE